MYDAIKIDSARFLSVYACAVRQLSGVAPEVSTVGVVYQLGVCMVRGSVRGQGSSNQTWAHEDESPGFSASMATNQVS